ncbi:MAG: cytochrome c3 family protein [Gammaproteobacteria bacterium]|jgi:hypothetical protein
MHLRIIFIALLSLLFSNVIAGELTIPQDDAVIQFETKIGVVTFAHQMHASLSITECKTCHHKLEPADTTVKPCHECHQHKKDGEAPKTKTAFHTRCIGCHEYTVADGGQAGPVKKKCKLCHIK